MLSGGPLRPEHNFKTKIKVFLPVWYTGFTTGFTTALYMAFKAILLLFIRCVHNMVFVGFDDSFIAFKITVATIFELIKFIYI